MSRVQIYEEFRFSVVEGIYSIPLFGLNWRHALGWDGGVSQGVYFEKEANTTYLTLSSHPVPVNISVRSYLYSLKLS